MMTRRRPEDELHTALQAHSNRTIEYRWKKLQYDTPNDTVSIKGCYLFFTR